MNAHSTMPTMRQRPPSTDERAAALQLRKIIADQLNDDGAPVRLAIGGAGDAAEVVIPPTLAQLMMELLRHIGRGEAVTLAPVRQMLTTQQAADILNVSRPHVVSLIDRGDMPHFMVGRHRRVRAEDLFRYKAQRDEARRTALERLAELDADLI